MRRVVFVLVLALGTGVVMLLGSPAAHASCSVTVTSGDETTQTSVMCFTEARSVVLQHADDRRITFTPVCEMSGPTVCYGPPSRCDDPAGSIEYRIYRGSTYLGLSCLTDGGKHDLVTITPAEITRWVGEQTWPPAPLNVQPGGGVTLLNLPTNFWTRTPSGLSRTLTRLGQVVDLSLSPAAFTFRYGDGGTRSTTDAGAPYPSLTNAHAYSRRTTVQPRVDVSYRVSYRVDGGTWTALATPLAVAGRPATLRIVPATPLLLG